LRSFFVFWFFFSAIVFRFISISFPGSVGLLFGHKWIEERSRWCRLPVNEQEHSHDETF
jgi:hypothetical protein